MTIPPYARLASRLLAKSTAEAAPPSAAARADAIAAIEAAIVRKRRLRRLSYTGYGIGVAAGLALASYAALRMSWGTQNARVEHVAIRPAVVAHAFGSGARIVGVGELDAADRVLAAGARVVASTEGHALLHFATGSEVTLEAASELALVEVDHSQTLALAHGALRAHVAKVEAGRHFIVKTPDAQIEVHGTSFRVAMVAPQPNCGGGTTTRVDVYEGVVSVRASGVDARVVAGERWPSGCDSPSIVHPLQPAPPNALAPVQPAPSQATPLVAARSREHKPADSMLATQNDMFARALAAHRAGDPASAVRELERLQGQFPDAPLAQDAAFECMRWLDTFDHARAADAARTYLARYPQGFARTQAEAIANSGQ